MMLRTLSPQRQVGKAGVRGFYIIMRAGLKGLISVVAPQFLTTRHVHSLET